MVGFKMGACISGTLWTQAGLSQMFTSRRDLPKYTKAEQNSASLRNQRQKICRNPVILSKKIRSIKNNKLCETKPISPKPKMVVTAVYTMTNNKKQRTMNYQKQSQNKPNQSQNKWPRHAVHPIKPNL